jgi:two-component sensor histidine kinase
VVIVFTDESAKKRTDEQLKRSLEEKEMLLKEIHHRVKNNMQVISSLLNLQSETIKDPATLAKFRESQYRVKSISLVHEKLYQSEDIERVDFREYLRSLSTYLFQSFGIDPGRIRLELTIDAMQVKIDTLIPCGLILNELITNSLKHAFADGESGTITIAGEKSDHGYTLTYHDDGCGIPAELDPDATETLGMQLITTLIAQLGGTMQLERDNGTTYIITCNRFLQ